jgi:hypothetical protein
MRRVCSSTEGRRSKLMSEWYNDRSAQSPEYLLLPRALSLGIFRIASSPYQRLSRKQTIL